jgi:hypothetical protein
MINEARTLLLNKSGAGRPPLGDGEEFVEPSFVPGELPPDVAAVRQVLFGPSPDDFTLNFRLAQFMSALHANPWGNSYVLGLDPRVTYREDVGLFAAVEQRNYQGEGSATAKVEFTSPYAGRPGRFSETWALAWTVDGSNLLLTHSGPVTRSTVQPFIAGASSWWTESFELGNSGCSVRLIDDTTATPGSQSVHVQLRTRPKPELPDLLSTLYGSKALVQELCRAEKEPYISAWNLFRDGFGTVERLSGALIALIERTRESRG